MQLYSEADARSLLPDVVPVLEALRDAFRALKAKQAEIAGYEQLALADGNLVADPWEQGGTNELEELKRDLSLAVQQLDRWGIELKDPERGLIDFYHQRDGEVVYLCYELGESDIAYWHTLQDGFAGRQPL